MATYRKVLEFERTRYEKTPDGKRQRFDETVRAEIEVEIDEFDLAFEMGQRAVWNKLRKSQSLRGAVKSRVVNEKILDSRQVR